MILAKLPNGEPEIFLAVQGEGISLGTPCIFVRLAGCTLDCVFCDTSYSKDMSQADYLSTNDVAKKISSLCGDKIKTVIFTGGEPLMQQGDICEVIEILEAEKGKIFRFEIETNGTVMPSNLIVALIDSFNCSPKLANSLNTKEARIKPEVLKKLSLISTVSYKFVTDGSDSEIQEIKGLMAEFSINDNEIFLMPKGDNSQEVLENSRNLVKIAMQEGWKITTRLHILLFEKERGV